MALVGNAILPVVFLPPIQRPRSLGYPGLDPSGSKTENLQAGPASNLQSRQRTVPRKAKAHTAGL